MRTVVDPRENSLRSKTQPPAPAPSPPDPSGKTSAATEAKPEVKVKR